MKVLIMVNKVILLIMLSFLFTNELSGEIVFRKEGSFFFKLNWNASSSSSYYDVDENLITSLKDESYKFDSLHCVNDYTMELTKKTIELSCEYSLSNELIVYGKLPISFNNLDEVFQYDKCAHTKYEKAKYSLTHVEHLGIGAKYELYNRKSYAAILFETRIPPGFKKGLIDTSKNIFLGDGAYELLSGLALGVKTDKYLLESKILYNYRDEELVDQFIIRIEAGICTVPNSKLSVIGDFVLSTKSFKEAIPLKTNQIVTQEDYFALEFEFSMFFSESIYGEFAYNLKLLGKNSWNFGTYRVGAGVLF
ncbi:MAG: hypothetical protein M1419_06005 [Bacteroidetes bacterium]|nr:hypothetical protein [Bacteroidota bacterium]